MGLRDGGTGKNAPAFDLSPSESQSLSPSVPLSPVSKGIRLLLGSIGRRVCTERKAGQ